MEQPNAIQSPQPAPQPSPQPAPAPQPTPAPAPSNYEDGGGLAQKIGDFKLVEYFTFAVVISAMIYSIVYHRQALTTLKK